MTANLTETAARLHRSGYRAVLTVTGGGSGLFFDLLSIPGGSRFLLDGRIPYSEAAAKRLIGPIDSFCSERTACRLACEAFSSAYRLLTEQNSAPPVSDTSVSSANEEYPAYLTKALGFGLTASLRSDRPKKGEHRIYAACQTAGFTASCSLTLRKGARTRLEEEQLTAALGLIALDEWTARITPDSVIPKSPRLFDSADTGFWGNRWSEKLAGNGFSLFPEEKIAITFLRTAPELAQLTAAKNPDSVLRVTANRFERCSTPKEEERCIFPGSFRPIHSGHCGMIRETAKRLRGPVALEISLLNADKPPVDPIDLFQRLETIDQTLPGQAVYLTGFPYFRQKGAFFAPAVLLLGADTLRRLDNPVYDGGEEAHQAVLTRLAESGCRFLTFARKDNETIYSLRNLPISPILRSICEEVPQEEFINDISSTQIRNNLKKIG